MCRELPDTERPDNAFFIALAGALLLVTALGLLLAVGIRPYAQVLALGHYTYNDEGYYRLDLALSTTRFGLLRSGLLVALMAGGGALFWTGRTPWQRVGSELGRAMHRLGARVRRLPGAAQATGIGVVVAVVAARMYYLICYPLSTDEVASYDFFVAHGPLAISSYYPIPNNHILYNLLAWPGFSLGLSPRWAMRLPSLLIGSAGTVAGGLLLARVVGWRLATVLTGLVGLGPLWVYYGAVGRGYILHFALLQISFFAVLELLREQSDYRHLAWAAFVVSSVLGLYTLPTHAYPLVALGLTLAWSLARQRRLNELLWAGGIIGLVSLLLYAPVGAVSGWEKLVSNRYVATRSAAQFWPPFRAIMYETAAELFGPSLRLSGPAWLAGAALGGWAARRLLPAGPRRQAALLAWALLATPLMLMALQRVYLPTRTLLYLTFAGYLMAALLLLQIGQNLTRNHREWRRFGWPLLLAGTLYLGGGRLWLHQSQVRASQRETRLLQQAYHWLQTNSRPTAAPPTVWLRAPLQSLFFAHYNSLTNGPRLRLYTSENKSPLRRYDFVVLDNYFLGTSPWSTAGYRVVYHDYLITIYAPH